MSIIQETEQIFKTNFIKDMAQLVVRQAPSPCEK